MAETQCTLINLDTEALIPQGKITIHHVKKIKYKRKILPR